MAELFESNWSATKDALLEGLNGSRKTSLDVVLENTKTVSVSLANFITSLSLIDPAGWITAFTPD